MEMTFRYTCRENMHQPGKQNTNKHKPHFPTWCKSTEQYIILVQQAAVDSFIWMWFASRRLPAWRPTAIQLWACIRKSLVCVRICVLCSCVVCSIWFVLSARSYTTKIHKSFMSLPVSGNKTSESLANEQNDNNEQKSSIRMGVFWNCYILQLDYCS